MNKTRVHVLERIMHERSLTQEQLGLLLGGVTRGRVNQLLVTGKPSNELLLRVATALHVSLLSLVDGEGSWLWFDV